MALRRRTWASARLWRRRRHPGGFGSRRDSNHSKVRGRLGCGKEECCLALRPVEGAAQLAAREDCCSGWKAAAVREGFAAAYAGPETAVGKAVVRFIATEVSARAQLWVIWPTMLIWGAVARTDDGHSWSTRSPPSQAQRSRGESWPASGRARGGRRQILRRAGRGGGR